MKWSLVVLFAVITTCKSEDGKTHSLFIMLIDGFRWDYVNLQPGQLRGFGKLFANGIRAEWVQPIFPTVSYPCWTTLSTGLYAENHNIVGNAFYDNERQSLFSLFADLKQNLDEKWWGSVEPIWTTATKLGKRAALFQWSACDVKHDGILPEMCESYEAFGDKMSVDQLMDKSLAALMDGFDLVMAYHGEVDTIGHQFGPESPECKAEVKKVDAGLLKFLDSLEKKGFHQKVNIILVSDHGMKHTGNNSGVQDVTLSVNPDDVSMVLDKGPWLQIKPADNKKEAVFQQLQNMTGVSVYRKEDIPERYHYKGSRLVQDILVVAHNRYYVLPLNGPKQVPPVQGEYVTGPGNHGYDPEDQDMRSIFFAAGPDFKKNAIHRPIAMVDIYQLYPYLLGIPPRPNNGTWTMVQDMLHEHPSNAASSRAAHLTLLLSLVAVVKLTL